MPAGAAESPAPSDHEYGEDGGDNNDIEDEETSKKPRYSGPRTWGGSVEARNRQFYWRCRKEGCTNAVEVEKRPSRLNLIYCYKHQSKFRGVLRKRNEQIERYKSEEMAYKTARREGNTQKAQELF